jgi:hypothetical protein
MEGPAEEGRREGWLVSKREYHYVITLQFVKEGVPGVNVNTIAGTAVAAKGATRQEVYQDVYSKACAALEIESGATLFCMLEPNQL